MNLSEAKAEIRAWCNSAAVGALDELGRFDALEVNFTGSDLLDTLETPEIRRLNRTWVSQTSGISFDLMIDAIGRGESHSFETWLHYTRMIDAAKVLRGRARLNPHAYGLLGFDDLFAGCPLDIETVFGDPELAAAYLARERPTEDIPEAEIDLVLGRLTEPSLKVVSRFDNEQVDLAMSLGLVSEQIEAAIRDRDRLIQSLSNSGVSLRVVGELAGVSHQTVKNVLAEARIRRERDLAEAF